jgi:hypothetical protein
MEGILFEGIILMLTYVEFDIVCYNLTKILSQIIKPQVFYLSSSLQILLKFLLLQQMSVISLHQLKFFLCTNVEIWHSNLPSLFHAIFSSLHLLFPF